MLYLYTENFFALSKLKNFVKNLLGRGKRGPEAVFFSLVKGLGELGEAYAINQPLQESIGTACVLSGVKVLTWAIEQKQRGKIKKIIAGPNLVISPLDCNAILLNSDIDIVVVPSQWVKDYYVLLAPELELKIKIWAAGVDVPTENSKPIKTNVLVLSKRRNLPILSKVVSYLESQNERFHYDLLFYGGFTQEQYFNILKSRTHMVYLSESESQGLALLEAWARNVPTLVWDKGYFEYQGKKVEGKIGAPYVSEQTGKTFKNIQDFERIFEEFISEKFSPREWVKNHATHAIAAKSYLNLI